MRAYDDEDLYGCGEALDFGRHTVRVLIADDHELTIEGIRHALADAADIEVVGDARVGGDVLRLALALRPDVVLQDLSMPGMDGLMCLQQLRERLPKIKVVVLSATPDTALIEAAISYGASAYIVKGIDPRDLAGTLRNVVEGNVYMPLRRPPPPTLAAPLTAREESILHLLAQGRTNRRIAQELWVSEVTVKFHLTNIYRKLNVTNRTGAVRMAFALGTPLSAGLDCPVPPASTRSA